MESIINKLKLQSHIEGGFYRQTFETSEYTNTCQGKRSLMNTIYYMLTADSPIGYLHRGRNDITHFFHLGAPMNYILLSPHGQIVKVTLGPYQNKGQNLIFTAPGSWWKCSFIKADSEFSLISEVVSPGFDFVDHEIAKREFILDKFPEHMNLLKDFIK